jgi:hypothetical protein
MIEVNKTSFLHLSWPANLKGRFFYAIKDWLLDEKRYFNDFLRIIMQ